MALGKMLRLGGIDNSIPRADQDISRFRVARNVRPTKDGYIIPRTGQTNLNDFPSYVKNIHLNTQHNTETLSVVTEDPALSGTGILKLYKSLTPSSAPSVVPMHLNCMGQSFMRTLNYDSSWSFTSYMKNGTTYFMNPRGPNYTGAVLSGRPIFKYDGVEVSPAGCPQPVVFSTSYSASGTKYIRVIQHCLDFDNNEPCSEYVQFRTSVATNLDIYSDGVTGNLIGLPEVKPSAIISPMPNAFGGNTTDTNYFVGLPSYDGVNDEYDFPGALFTNITLSSQIGSYVFVSASYLSSAASGLSAPSLAIALKVKSVSPLTFSNDPLYLDLNREWQTATVVTPTTLAAAISYGSRKFFSVWASASEFGNYVYRGFGPAFPEELSLGYTFNVDVSSVTTPIADPLLTIAFTTSQNLGDWYDTQSKKLCFNSVYDFGQRFGLTNYQDLLIAFTDDLVWFSDTTLGGSYEQFNALSFIKVGDSQFGRVISVCGTSDFLFVGRERKNYYITGNITTGNYRAVEVDNIETGPYVNNATINVKNSVVMVACDGIYTISDGGRGQKISNRISQNFKTFGTVATPEDVAFKIDTISGQEFSSDFGLSISYDEYREYLAICQRGASFPGNPTLILDVQSGEFYEWTYISSSSSRLASCVHFQNAKLYVGEFQTGQLGADRSEENTSALDGAVSPIKLYSTWLTGGEPSLEKEALQLKMFGNIYPVSSSVSLDVVSFKDWDISTKVTEAQYFPPAASTYSHKKRLNSDKVLALSVGIEVDNTSSFRIEGIEVEFNPIQRGMKR